MNQFSEVHVVEDLSCDWLQRNEHARYILSIICSQFSELDRNIIGYHITQFREYCCTHNLKLP